VDWNNHRIREVQSSGNVRTIAGVGELGDTNGPALDVRLNHPTDVAFNPVDGELYIAAWHIDKVKKLVSADNTIVAVNKADGKRAYTGDGGLVSAAEMNLPSSVKFNAAGDMFIADQGNRRIRWVNHVDQFIDALVGDGTAGYGGDEGDGLLAKLNLSAGQNAQPSGRICLDPTEQYLYIADTDNHRVRRYDVTNDEITTIAGDGTAGYLGDGAAATAGRLSSPVDVDCDAAGNVYICDRDNHCVRKVTLSSGFISTVVGTGVAGYSGDKGAATGAALRTPSGIYVDRVSGRLYIADTYNSVVRVVWE